MIELVFILDQLKLAKFGVRRPSVLTCRGASPGIYHLIPKSDIVGNDILVKHLFTETAL